MRDKGQYAHVAVAPDPRRKSPRKKDEDVTIPKGMEILRIPTGLIRRMVGQPRRNFDEDELHELAKSIKKDGQQTPITVRRIRGHRLYRFELVNGERRWRACKIAKVGTVLAFVKSIKNEREQFRHSVTANFFHVDHTSIEIAYAVKRLRDDFIAEGVEEKKVLGRVADIFGRSIAWAYQYLGLLRLRTEVQELMDEGKVTFQIGVALIPVIAELQLQAAERAMEIMEKKGLKMALHYIRTLRNKAGNLAPGGQRRSPNVDYKRLVRFLDRVRKESEIVLDLPEKHFEAMFRNRSQSDIASMLEIVTATSESLEQIRETLAALQGTMTAKAS